MKSFRVYMQHWQRREPMPEGATVVDHLEVVVSAPTGSAATRAAKALLPEWSVLVALGEVAKPDTEGRTDSLKRP